MLEGWELILVFGGIAVTMLSAMAAAILYFLSNPKIITTQSQSHSTQQNSQHTVTHYPSGRICIKCGISAAGNAKFCSNCGKHLS